MITMSTTSRRGQGPGAPHALADRRLLTRDALEWSTADAAETAELERPAAGGDAAERSVLRERPIHQGNLAPPERRGRSPS